MQIDFSQHIHTESLSPKNEFEEKVIFFLQDWFSASETVAVQTSGSTGTPKILEIEKQKMINSAKMTCDFLGLEEGNSALLCLPIQYISGKMMLVRAIHRKLKIIIAEPKATLKIPENIDFCAMSPLQVQYSLDQIHRIKNLIIGGAAVSETLKKQIAHQLSAHVPKPISPRIYETFGMSETLSHIALRQIFPISEACFTVLNEVEISTDERNCLRIFAPKIHSEILQTNDIVELIHHKQFNFLGRIDHVINSGGVKIFAEELENFVKKNIPRELIFIGKPNETLGEQLVLVIEGEEDENIKREVLSLKMENKFHVPKQILFLKKFPRAENGKVLRKEIRKLI